MFRHAILLAALMLPFGAPALAQAARDQALHAYLAKRLTTDRCAELEDPTRYLARWVDLNGDGRPEAVVYVTGGGQCGSGGCGLLVLESTASGFRERGALTISRPPIEVLPYSTRGWRDLSVLVSGGGILPGYRARIPFDGRRYASNPTVPPAKRLARGRHGELLIDASKAYDGVRLMPEAPPPPAPRKIGEGEVRVRGRLVDVLLPPAPSCWSWQALDTSAMRRGLRYLTGDFEGDRQVWRFEADEPLRTSQEFALLPQWRPIYEDAEKRRAAAKIWKAEIVVP